MQVFILKSLVTVIVGTDRSNEMRFKLIRQFNKINSPITLIKINENSMNLKKLQRAVSDDFYSCSLKNVLNVEAFVKVLAVLTVLRQSKRQLRREKKRKNTQ